MVAQDVVFQHDGNCSAWSVVGCITVFGVRVWSAALPRIIAVRCISNPTGAQRSTTRLKEEADSEIQHKSGSACQSSRSHSKHLSLVTWLACMPASPRQVLSHAPLQQLQNATDIVFKVADAHPRSRDF